IFIDDSDSLHWTNRPIHVVGAKEIFQYLVFDSAVAGLLDRQFCQRFCARDSRFRDFKENALDLLLAEVFEFQPCLVCRMKQTSSFLNRFKIFINQGDYPGVLSGFAVAPDQWLRSFSVSS